MVSEELLRTQLSHRNEIPAFASRSRFVAARTWYAVSAISDRSRGCRYARHGTFPTIPACESSTEPSNPNYCYFIVALVRKRH